MDRTYRYDGRLCRIDRSRHDLLNRRDKIGGAYDRIDGFVRRSAVAAEAIDLNFDGVARSVKRPFAKAERAYGIFRGEMQPIRPFDVEALDDAFLHHLLRTAFALFGGLNK
ncbi:MAG: hypothetical protein NVS1B14_12970 [Vulcanimicrobiaceae bacterium]